MGCPYPLRVMPILVRAVLTRISGLWGGRCSEDKEKGGGVEEVGIKEWISSKYM